MTIHRTNHDLPHLTIAPRGGTTRVLYGALLAYLVVVTATAYALGTVTIRCPEGLLFAGLSVGAISAGAGLLAVAATQRGRAVGEATLALGAWLLAMMVTLIASAVLTPFVAAPADALLAAPELWLGVTQPDVTAWAARSGLVPLLGLVYNSHMSQAWLTFAYWSLWRQDTRPIWDVATAFAACAVIGLPLYVLFPAVGPWIHYEVTGEAPQWLCSWLSMRDGPHVVEQMDGWIAAPSFHAVLAVLLTYCWWATPLRLAAVVAGGVMLLATWVVGHHYLTDLVLGVAIAGACLVMVRLAGGDR